jgi:hypothetical protein
MRNIRDNHFCFIRLRFRDYKIFGGINDFRFNRYKTLIVGKGGTGKTTIAETLNYLGHAKDPHRKLLRQDHAVSSIAVVTEGNCDLANKYRHLILINSDYAGFLANYNQPDYLRRIVPRGMWSTFAFERQKVFHKILSYKKCKIDLSREFNPQVMARGEKVCFGYACFFAIRNTLKLDIPVVLDSPYAMLDEELRKGFRKFLDTQSCQQILLGNECEFSKEEIPKYILVYVEERSHVMEF